MKKYIITLCLVVGLGTTIVGCRDYLDSDYIFDERMSIEQVFQSKDYTNEWLARGYTYLKHDYLQQVNSKKNTSFNFADDMYYGDLNYVDWKSGNYTEKGLGTGNSLYIWQPAYQGIRHLSVFRTRNCRYERTSAFFAGILLLDVDSFVWSCPYFAR